MDIFPKGDYFLRRAGPDEAYLTENGRDGRLVLGRNPLQKGLFRLSYRLGGFICRLQSVTSDTVVQFKDQIGYYTWGSTVVSPTWGIGAFPEDVRATPADFVFHSIDARTRTVVELRQQNCQLRLLLEGCTRVEFDRRGIKGNEVAFCESHLVNAIIIFNA